MAVCQKPMYRSYMHSTGQRQNSITSSFIHWSLSDDSSLQVMLYPATVQAVIQSPSLTGLPLQILATQTTTLDKFWPDNYQTSPTTPNTNLIMAVFTLPLKLAVLIKTAFAKRTRFFPTGFLLSLARPGKESRIYTA